MVSRPSNDITRTTMVNILPITAYSRPLSASKMKKNNVKQRTETVRKKSKPIKKIIATKELSVSRAETKTAVQVVTSSNDNKIGEKQDEDVAKTEAQNTKTPPDMVSSNKQDANINLSASTVINDKDKANPQLAKAPQEDAKIKKSCNEIKDSNNPTAANHASIIREKICHNMPESNDKTCKIAGVKDIQPVEKSKLSNILESTLCENTVDGGNARLELAEELLAASPTAAFLMSFPLVSGNRAESPAEETQNLTPSKDNTSRRNDIPSQPVPYFEKPNTNVIKEKPIVKQQNSTNTLTVKDINPNKFTEQNLTSKQLGAKTSNSVTTTSTDNPFLNLSMPSNIPTNCTLTDPTFSLDFDCNIAKTLSSQSTSYGNNNIFYKSDPFNSAVKSTIYSTSSISSGHDFNTLGLYPCAMEKYSSKSKTDYPNVEENLMKIGSSRLTYDIDLGWSHKGFDFVNCTTSSTTFPKDNLLTTTVSTPYTTSYNPFNPEFHVPLVSTTSKKDNMCKPSSSFVDTIASFYSQTPNLWSEEMPFYTSNSISSSKTFPPKHQNYLPLDHTHSSALPKQTSSKQYEAKQITENCADNVTKPPSLGMSHQISDKYTKKSPSKMHINWMTSETRPIQNSSCNTVLSDVKDLRIPYTQIEHVSKKQDQSDGNYFPISMHTYPSHAPQEEFQVWPSARPLGTTEISIDPPPINLPTLVGDLALGPHDKKRQNAESHNRAGPQVDLQQNCSNFLSVTQLMNRSTDNMSSRYHGTNEPAPKPTAVKQNSAQYSSDHNRKLTSTSRLENNLTQPCYSFNDSKAVHSYDAMNQFTNTKVKPSKSADKSAKNHKHSYSAEALIRGNTFTQKLPDNKFVMTSQKYNDCNPQQDNSVAQVSHFPSIIDYADNSYTGQQFSGTTLYNPNTNTISNSLYSNFMPGSGNLMPTNYAGAPFSSEFMDYNQSAECNYPNHKYEEFKIKGNPPVFHPEKGSSNHKPSRREFTAKHKMDCSKKDSNKKYQSKRPKLSEVEDWSENNLLWQNKTPSKRHANLMTEELSSFPNYVGNQVPSQYQPDIFNSHLMPPNVQSMGHNVDRSLTSFPATSRANFNLSTIFPEITMVSYLMVR